SRYLCFFFFQAEDGIRDLIVTGVQTCALPIFPSKARTSLRDTFTSLHGLKWLADQPVAVRILLRDELVDLVGLARRDVDVPLARSEERRVGKECRSRWSREHDKEKHQRVSCWS